MTLADLRTEYCQAGLTEADAGDDPFALFTRWMAQAVAAGLPEPTAMTLATATPDGRPSARVVLLKHFDARGFTFFTHYESRKGRELAANPHAALVLFWNGLERQVRIEGVVERVAAAESDVYFAARPRGSRLGAMASPQSQVVPDRATLERKMAELDARYPGDTVPRPVNWGGYRVKPQTIEFWQGRPNRLHDRLRFRIEKGSWMRERLGP